MGSPAKPFACEATDCGMRFTNEDHLTVHSRKHDLELQLALGNKTAVFPADQTPTPTRFIRNCEEVGLFQDLQNVNPFDEGFKRAMETKSCMLASLDSIIATATSDDALHTPHIFPNLADVTETNLFNTNSKTITRSSSDESTTVKHYESTIETRKLTNEVTIKDDNVCTNNVITIQSNIEITKADFSTFVATNEPNMVKLVVTNNEKDHNVVKKDVLLTDAGKVPVMSQKSLDFALDSLNSHLESEKPCKNQNLINTMKRNIKDVLQKSEKKNVNRRKFNDNKAKNDYEVMIKLPNGELVHMKSYEDEKKSNESKSRYDSPKQKLKEALENKIKAELEKEIRTDLEKKINDELKSGKYVLNGESPQTAKSISSTALPIDNTIPILVLPSEQLLKFIPVSQIPVQQLFLPTKRTNKRTSSNVKKKKKLETKPTQHQPGCDIFKKVGAECNMNCDDVVIVPENEITQDVNEKISAIIDNESDPTLPDEFHAKKSAKNEKATVFVNILPKIIDTPKKTPVSVLNIANNSCNVKVASHKASCGILNRVGGFCDCLLSCSNQSEVSKDPAIAVGDVDSKGRQIDLTDIMNKSKSTSVYDFGNVFSSKDVRRESNQEAVRRYRAKQKDRLRAVEEENRKYEREMRRLRSELHNAKLEIAGLKKMLLDHCSVCPTTGNVGPKRQESAQEKELPVN